jgi:hypothetical protein
MGLMLDSNIFMRLKVRNEVNNYEILCSMALEQLFTFWFTNPYPTWQHMCVFPVSWIQWEPTMFLFENTIFQLSNSNPRIQTPNSKAETQSCPKQPQITPYILS